MYALALFLACMFTPHANAVPPTYTGEAPVNSQSDEERVDALKTALANVVIEQTGDPGVLSRSDVASAVGKAERYVLQFRYKRGATDGSGPPLILVAEFDSTAVDAMLQRLGLGANGPGTAAPIETTPSEATVWIGGIRSAEDYARVIAYLGKNNLVRGVQPKAGARRRHAGPALAGDRSGAFPRCGRHGARAQRRQRRAAGRRRRCDACPRSLKTWRRCCATCRT